MTEITRRIFLTLAATPLLGRKVLASAGSLPSAIDRATSTFWRHKHTLSAEMTSAVDKWRATMRATSWRHDFEKGTYTPFPDGADPMRRYNVDVQYVKVIKT